MYLKMLGGSARLKLGHISALDRQPRSYFSAIIFRLAGSIHRAGVESPTKSDIHGQQKE